MRGWVRLENGACVVGSAAERQADPLLQVQEPDDERAVRGRERLQRCILRPAERAGERLEARLVEPHGPLGEYVGLCR